MNIHTKLENTRQTLQALGDAVYNLVTSSSDIFDDPAIQSRLEDFQTAHKEATQRLLNPRLIMAAIGTTSSGKSTAVNALMGRSIAPIEAGEMSGGVLTLRHSEESRLIIEATPEAVWETGEWTGLSDDEIYSKIQVVMHRYHQERKKKELIAPQIKVDASLFPACDLTFSGLPEGIGLEFLDLPGLKSVQDGANLEVIKPLVGKAFSIVTLDYTQVDEKHRQSLLAELKKVVEYLQGRTDSMIFVLNRVDRRTQKDKSIEERIAELKVEIKDILGLKEEPDVLSFNALLLFYAQCAWGNSPLRDPSTVDPEVRSQLLKSLFKDCANIIEDKTEEDLTLYEWFSNIKKIIRQGKFVDDYKMRRILYLAMKWSGGEDLWNCIRKRIQESFNDLVILPALLGVFNNLDSLLQALYALIKTKTNDNQKELTEELNKIANIRHNLKKNVKYISHEFQEEVKSSIDLLNSRDVKTRDQAKIDIEKKIKGWIEICRAIDDIEYDLLTSIIVPVRDAFDNNQPAFSLREQLREIMPIPLAEDIANHYDVLSRRMTEFTPKSDFLCQKVRSDDDDAVKKIEEDERFIRNLYLAMRKGITARAEFLVQTKEQKFEDALTSFVKQQGDKLNQFLSEQNLSIFDIETFTDVEINKQLAQDLSKLSPNKIFEMVDNINKEQRVKSEVVGTETYYEYVTKTRTETYQEEYQEKFLFFFKRTKKRPKTRTIEYKDKETKTRNKYEEIEYIELSLPSAQSIAEQCSDSITQNREKLWDILSGWIISRLKYVTMIFERSVMDITELAERTLNEQLKIIESNFEETKQKWNVIEISVNNVKKVRDQLDNDARAN